ncbi:MAG: hypothetical protein WCF95_02195 [bacterium]
MNVQLIVNNPQITPLKPIGFDKVAFGGLTAKPLEMKTSSNTKPTSNVEISSEAKIADLVAAGLSKEVAEKIVQAKAKYETARDNGIASAYDPNLQNVIKHNFKKAVGIIPDPAKEEATLGNGAEVIQMPLKEEPLMAVGQ